MPQTLQALCALALLGLSLLHVTQGRYKALADSIDQELEVQARGLALEVVERVSTYPYDGSVAGTSTTTDSTQTTASTSGWSVEKLFTSPSHNDLGDFDGVADVGAVRYVTNAETGKAGPLDYRVSFSVEYVEQVGTRWMTRAAPTAHRRVTVQIDQDQLVEPVRLARIVSDRS